MRGVVVWATVLLWAVCAADFRRAPARDLPSTRPPVTVATSSRRPFLMRGGDVPRGPWKDWFQTDASGASTQTAPPTAQAAKEPAQSSAGQRDGRWVAESGEKNGTSAQGAISTTQSERIFSNPPLAHIVRVPASASAASARNRAAKPSSSSTATTAPRVTQHPPPASQAPTNATTTSAPSSTQKGSIDKTSSSSSTSSKTQSSKPAPTDKPSSASTEKTSSSSSSASASTDVTSASSSSPSSSSSSTSSSTSSSSSSSSSTKRPDTVTPAGAMELVFVASIFRGGARTPFVPLPNTQSEWEAAEDFEGFGRLTYIGERQMLDLGRSLYETYKDFFQGKDTFSPSLVTARATDAAWSISSARALLTGMFPSAWVVPHKVPQVFPVHVNLEKDDLLLLAPRNCPLYRFEMQEQLHRISNPQWARVLAKSESLRTHFRHMYKDQMDASSFTLENWDVFYDPLECYRANGEGKPFNLTEKQIDDVLDIGQELERVNYPTSHGGMLGGNLMSHVISLMRQAIAERNKTGIDTWEKRPRFHLFSGHRETISSLLAMLGQPIDVIPKFSDHMEIQLLRTIATNAHAVRIVYNTNNALKVCGNRTLEACEFARFEEEMSAKLAQDWGLSCEREEKKSCLKKEADHGSSGKSGGKEFAVVSPINGLWYVVSLAAVLLVIAVSILVFWKWKRRAQEGDEPEEIPMRPVTRRGPKKFTLE